MFGDMIHNVTPTSERFGITEAYGGWIKTKKLQID